MTRAQRVVLRAVFVAFPFAAVEIAVRILVVPPIPMVVPSADPLLVYQLNPDYPEVNSAGMRQPELEPAALERSFVVAVIGDSHAYSTRSPKWQESFPSRLERHLAELSGKPVQVLNFGVPGYDMTQELETLEKRALPYRPDLVVLQYCINDEHVSNYIWPRHPWLNSALHASRFLSKGWMTLLYSEWGTEHLLATVEAHAPDLLLFTPGLVGTPRAHDPDPAHAPHPPRDPAQVPERYHAFLGRANLEQNVRRFGELARSAGVPLVATGFIEERDRTLYESAGFEVLSYFEIFGAHGGPKLKRFGYDSSHTDTHFTSKGSDLIGRGLAEFVARKFPIEKGFAMKTSPPIEKPRAPL